MAGQACTARSASGFNKSGRRGVFITYKSWLQRTQCIASGVRGLVVISAELQPHRFRRGMEGEGQIAETLCEVAEELPWRKLLQRGHGRKALTIY